MTADHASPGEISGWPPSPLSLAVACPQCGGTDFVLHFGGCDPAWLECAHCDWIIRPGSHE